MPDLSPSFGSRKRPRKSQSNWDKYQKKKGNTTQRGYGHAWRKLRKQALERDLYLCQICLKSKRLTEATTVDHIKPKAFGGDDTLDNLQSLCDGCHKHKTATETKGGAG